MSKTHCVVYVGYCGDVSHELDRDNRINGTSDFD